MSSPWGKTHRERTNSTIKYHQKSFSHPDDSKEKVGRSLLPGWSTWSFQEIANMVTYLNKNNSLIWLFPCFAPALNSVYVAPNVEPYCICEEICEKRWVEVVAAHTSSLHCLSYFSTTGMEHHDQGTLYKSSLSAYPCRGCFHGHHSRTHGRRQADMALGQ